MWEQLTYTSVDEVVDSKNISGWHIKDRTPGLTDEQAEALLSFVRQALTPIKPLGISPTRQEMYDSDRRLSQFVTPWGTALVHTAPAGLDATQRPNTMTHILLEVDPGTNPTDYLIDFWRAPWWLTPHNHETVKQSSLPPSDLIGIGSSDVSGDDARGQFIHKMQGFLDEPGRLNALGALVDAVALGIEGEEAENARRTIVMPIASSDEAAFWIAAMSRLTLPAHARRISWSTLERLASPLDVQGLSKRGLDIAFVPKVDLENLRTEGTELVVLSDALDQPIEPRSRWGSLASGALGSLEKFSEVCGEVQFVGEEIGDQSDISLAWPLAIAGGGYKGLLTPPDGSKAQRELEDLIDRELLVCQSSEWEQGSLSDPVKDRYKGEGRSAGQWYGLMAPLGKLPRVSQLLHVIADQYIDAVVRDSEWLQTPRELTEGIETCIGAWSEQQSIKKLNKIFEEALLTLEEARGEEMREGWRYLIVLESFLSDGMKWTQDRWDQFVDHALWIGPAEQYPHLLQIDSQLTTQVTSAEARSQLREYAEELLKWDLESGDSRSKECRETGLFLPVAVAKDSLTWMCEGAELSSTPILRATYGVTRWQREVSPEAKQALLEALEALEMGYTLDNLVIQSLAAELVSADLPYLTGLHAKDRRCLMDHYLLSNQDSPGSAAVARDYLVDIAPSDSADGLSQKETLNDLQKLALVLSSVDTLTVTGSREGSSTRQRASRAASDLLDGSRGSEISSASEDSCRVLERRVYAKELLRAWATGGQIEVQLSEVQKDRLKSLRLGEQAALENLFTPEDELASNDLRRAVNLLCLVDLLNDPRNEAVRYRSYWKPLEQEIGEKFRKYDTSLKSALHQSSTTIRNVLRARVMALDPAERDQLWEELVDVLPPVYGREWLRRTLEFAPSIRARRPRVFDRRK